MRCELKGVMRPALRGAYGEREEDYALNRGLRG